MPRLPEIDNLRSIAENALLEPGSRPRSSLKEVIPHDAQSLFQLVKTSSLVVTEPHSRKREKFVEYYRACLSWDTDFESNAKLLNDKLWDLMQLVDELFFFHTLTRGTKGPNGREGLVSLRVDSTSDKGLASHFIKSERQITVFLYPTPGDERHEFKHLFYSIIHEMCHAFLDFFSDQSHPKHREWVELDRGHGSLFWRLLRFLVEAIMDITQSPVWKFGFDRWMVFRWEKGVKR
ncbi:hypothetical protein F5X98DRAFT_383136 [Xylaria grammica]|nr:hypothetical protein F5X98DRAFT_383136 [Xylaria grammica]